MFVAPRADDLIGDARRPVQDIQRVALRQVGIQVQEGNLANQATALQGESRTRTDQTATTDNANFHDALSVKDALSQVTLASSPGISDAPAADPARDLSPCLGIARSVLSTLGPRYRVIVCLAAASPER